MRLGRNHIKQPDRCRALALRSQSQSDEKEEEWNHGRIDWRERSA